MPDFGLVPYEVTRTWTVLAAGPSDAAERARPGEHHDVVIVRTPCADWPAPCTHDPEHVRPDGARLAATDVLSAARALLEEALRLRMYGERAPGGDETWREWDRRTEEYLRSLPVRRNDG